MAITLISRTSHDFIDPLGGIPNNSKVEPYSIGKQVTFTALYTVDDILEDGDNIYFNPGLFLPSSNPNPFAPGQPPSGWAFTFLNALVGAGANNMSSYGNGVNDQQLRNGLPQIEFLTTTTFTISMTFVLTVDLNNFIAGQTVNNFSRLLRSHVNDPSILNKGIDSVYTLSEGRSFFDYLVINDVSAATFISFYNGIDSKARFYNSGIANAAATLTNQRFELERGGNIVTSLSAYNDTTVRMTINDPGANVPVKLQAWLIRLDNAPLVTSLDFETAYDKSYAEIDTDAGSGQKDNAIYAPTVAPTSIGSDDYEARMTVKGSELYNGGIYRIICVWHTATYTESFISDLILANAQPFPCSPDFTSKFEDYNREIETLYLQTVVSDRLKAVVDVDKNGYNDCVDANPTLPYNDFDTDITRIECIVTLQVSPFPIQITVSATKDNLGNWNSTSSLLEIDDIDTENMTCKLAFRNLFDTDSLTGWDNDEVTFDWVFVFDYPTVPLQQKIVFQQRISVLTWDHLTPRYDWIESIKYYNAETGERLRTLCGDNVDTILVEVTLSSGAPSGPKTLIAFVDEFPFGVSLGSDNNLLEEESYVAATSLNQLANGLIFDVDEFFVNNRATYKVDASQLNFNSQYRGCAIVKKAIGEDCNPPATVEVEMTVFDLPLGLYDFDISMSYGGGLSGVKPLIEMYDVDTGTVLGSARFAYGDDISSAAPIVDSSFVSLFQPYFSAGSLIEDGGTLRIDKLNWATDTGFANLPLTKNAVDLGLRVILDEGGQDEDSTGIQGYAAGANGGSHAVPMSDDLYFTMQDGSEKIYLYDLSDDSMYNQQDLDGQCKGLAIDPDRTVNGYPVIYAALLGLVTSDYSGQLILHEITYSGVGNTFNSVKISAALSDTLCNSLLMDAPGREWDINANTDPRRIIFLATSPVTFPSRIMDLAWDSSLNLYVEGAGLDLGAWNTSSHAGIFLCEAFNDDILFYSGNDGINKLTWTNSLADNDPTNSSNWDCNPTNRFTLNTSPTYEDYDASARIVDGTTIVPRRGKFIVSGTDGTRNDYTGGTPMFWATGGNGGPTTNLTQWEWDYTTHIEVSITIQTGTCAGTLGGAGTTLIKNLNQDKAIQFASQKNYVFDIATGVIDSLMPYDATNSGNAFQY